MFTENSPSYQELTKQAEELLAKAEEARKQEIAGVVSEIKEKMAAHGLKLEDLNLKGFKGTKSGNRSVVAPKYRHHVTGETWSGRGKMPNWITKELGNGRSKEDFLIAA